MRVRPELQYHPQGREHLVASIRDAEAAGRRVKAVGSAWSFENVMTPGDGERVVFTEGLNRVWLHDVAPVRLTDGDRDASGHWRATVSSAPGVNPTLLRDVVRPGHPNLQNLVLVEGGVKLRWLNDWLWRNRRAMQTAGGSAGQSIAGLISTGSHGGDLAFGPLTELVVGLHLVGARGQEHWIERASRPLSEPARAGRIHRAFDCREIEVHHDDDLFNAVVLGLGRFGVLYALVLEVRNWYQLTETAFMTTWSEVRPRLAREDPTLFPAPATGAPRFLQLDVIPHTSGSGNPVVVKQRTEVPIVGRTAPPRRPPEVDLFGQLCTRDFPAQQVRAILTGAAAATAGSTSAAAGLFAFLDLFAPGVGTTLAAGTAIGGTVLTGELLTQALQTIEDDTVDVMTIIRRLVSHLSGPLAWVARDVLTAVVTSINFSPGPTTSWSYDIMDTYSYGEQCFLVRAGEFVFPFGTGDLRALQLVDDIIARASQGVDSGKMVPALMSIRFGGRGSAHLSMHRTRRNCAIEVPVIQGFDGSDEFMEDVHDLAKRREALSHWGQELRATRTRLERTYASSLERWRVQLAKMVDPRNPETFASRWTERLALEPDPETLLRRALGG